MQNQDKINHLENVIINYRRDDLTETCQLIKLLLLNAIFLFE